MKDHSDKLEDITIVSAHDVEPELLFDFYSKMFPYRKNLPEIWSWLNRSSFMDNRIPLVIIHNKNVIAHAGMIPFYMKIDGRNHTGCWFIDFAVLPEFQNRGLGSKLTKAWMEISDIGIEIGHNIRSGAVFTKMGWTGSSDTFLHYFFLKPLDHPKFQGTIPNFMRGISNKISKPFLKVIYQKYGISPEKIEFDDLELNALDEFRKVHNDHQHSEMLKRSMIPVRDRDYLTWRLMNSPENKNYRVFRTGEAVEYRCIIKLNATDKVKYIDILLFSGFPDPDSIKKMISTLALWGMKNNYSYIRFYTSSEQATNVLESDLKSLVRHPNFMFYTKDTELIKKLKSYNWNFGLIDNDFERI